MKNKQPLKEQLKAYKKQFPGQIVTAVHVFPDRVILVETEHIKEALGNRVLEKNLTDRALRYLRTLPRCVASKRHAGPGRRGEPDITGCIEGRRYELEVKVGSNMPTDMQWKQMEKWADSGAITGVFWTIDGLKSLMSAQTVKIKLAA